MTTTDKFRNIVRKLISERIDADKTTATEISEMDKKLKKIDSTYRVMINNSFSRIVFDDGQSGHLFSVELNPVVDTYKKDVPKYDMRAIFFGGDRVMKVGLSFDAVIEYIDGEFTKKIKGEKSYSEVTQEKSKKIGIQEAKEEKPKCKTCGCSQKDCECTDEMEEVKKIVRQSDKDGGKDAKDIDGKKRNTDELIAGLGLDDFAEKIENAVWGAIKRAVEESKPKPLKPTHDVKNLDTKKNSSQMTKAKANSQSTEKLKDKPKPAETSHAIKSKDTKVNTPKVKDFKDSDRKAKEMPKK